MHITRFPRITGIGFIVVLLIWSMACSESVESPESELDTREGSLKPLERPVAAANFLAIQLENGMQIPDLKPEGDTEVFTGEALYEYINGGAEVYHDYGFIEVAVQKYSLESTQIVADIYRFSGSDNAYGLYASMRPDDPDEIDMGVEGYASLNVIEFVKGDYLVRLTGDDDAETTMGAAGELAKVIHGNLPGTAEKPAKLLLLPQECRIPFTDKFQARAFLGQKFLTDVYKQDYIVDGRALTAFLSADVGGAKYRAWIERIRNDRHSKILDEKPPFEEGNGFVFTNRYYGTIAVGLQGGLLVGIVNYSAECGEFLAGWLSSLR